MPRITAAMIVRNEERFLPGCLASLRQEVDEIVIVDTGSDDRSREIALDRGAVVIDHPWRSDFAEARNVGLDHATGDWILYIDADERLVVPEPGALRRAVALPDAVAGRVRFRPRVAYTPYREIRYQGEPIAPIKSFDTEGRVIYLGSFSKILAPGLRLGWAVASEQIIQQLGLLKLAADTQCSTLNMAAVSLFLDTYDIDAHIATIRRTYRRKKDLMLDTIRHTFPQDVAFTEPSGGLFTWLTFPEGFDTTRFMAEHALPEAKVAYVPGATFFPLEQEANHARLSYSTQTDEAIVKGITALGRLLTARRSA